MNTGVPVVAQVPAPLTALIGREVEVAQLRTLLTDEAARLVTVTGAGGCGKTRLAIEVAPQVGATFNDGVAFVGLAAVNDPALAAGEVARALGIATPVGVTEIDALTEALRTRQMLLMLDNFEHLMPATNLVAAVLGRCAGVSLLVTSRRRLQLPGERVMPLPPLRVPPQQGDAPHASPGPAVELFWERARAVAPHLERTPASAGAVAEICARLDGLPLAIELAAARSRMLTPEAMLQRLATMTWAVLDRTTSDVPSRTDRLELTIGWSHDLLDHRARALLRRLSVFETSFSLDAAEAIVADGDYGGLRPEDVFDGIAVLVDLHLVEPEFETAEPSYVMLQTIRLYALDRLIEAGELDRLRDRHAAHFLALCVDIAGAVESDQEQQAYLRLDRVLPELRAAMTRFRATGRHDDALRLAISLGPYWLFRAKFLEGRRWLSHQDAADATVAAQARGWSARLAVEAGGIVETDSSSNIADLEHALSVLEGSEDRRAWLWAVEHLSYALRLYGSPVRAAEVTDVALAYSAAAGLQWWRAELLHRRCLIAFQCDDTERALELARAALDAANASGHERIDARALQALVILDGFGGDRRRSREALEQVLARSEAFGDLRGVGSTLTILGAAAGLAGDRVGAMAWLQRAIDHGRQTGYWHGGAMAVVGVAAITAQLDPAAAARLHGALTAHLPVLEREMGSRYVGTYRRAIATAEQTLGTEPFTRAVTLGRNDTWASTLDEARALTTTTTTTTTTRTTSQLQQPQPESTAVSRRRRSNGHSIAQPLSDRELEVLAEMVAGKTNQEIAAALFMSPKTAMHHTGHIYRKLGLRGRAQTVAYAIEHGLVATR